MVAAYAEAKAAREVMDYGDQMALAARIAARHPEVGAAERARYHVVLLDEYQDTSHAQLVLLRALFGGGHRVHEVGHPCQSIYGWRGATAGSLRRFATDFPVRSGTPARTALLSTSFRNTGRVLDAAAAIQEGLRASAPEVPRLVAPPPRAARGQVVCALLETAAKEAEWIADRIAQMLRLPPGVGPDGSGWPDGRPDRVHPADIAVLCRKRAQFPVPRPRTRRSDMRGSRRGPPSCGCCAGTRAAPCRNSWARWSAHSGSTSRWPRGPVPTRRARTPTWTRSRTRRRPSPATRTSRRWARSWPISRPPRQRSSAWKRGGSAIPTRGSWPPCTRRRACNGPRGSCPGCPGGRTGMAFR